MKSILLLLVCAFVLSACDDREYRECRECKRHEYVDASPKAESPSEGGEFSPGEIATLKVDGRKVIVHSNRYTFTDDYIVSVEGQNGTTWKKSFELSKIPNK